MIFFSFQRGRGYTLFSKFYMKAGEFFFKGIFDEARSRVHSSNAGVLCPEEIEVEKPCSSTSNA